MLFLRSWLEDYIDLSGYSNKELADIITTRSSEVEEIRVINDYFDGKVLVGQIKNVKPHPDADRLKIFDVMIGDDKSVKIVSAAENVKEDLVVPVAIEGAKLPFGMTIVPRKMRGVESQGMCCGQSELMIETEYSSGLWELASEFEKGKKPVSLGVSICDALPDYFPEEAVLDIKVLPNKIGVIGSYLGMALEIAFCLENRGLLKRKAMRILDPEVFLDDVKSRFVFKGPAIKRDSVKFEDNTGYTKSFSLFDVTCNTTGEYRLDKDIQKRMFLTGINMIGGLTDISNYLLYDVGQPTHFFSRSKMATLGGGNNVNWKVITAKKDTKFEGLGQLKETIIPDGVKILVDTNDNILSIPGISGGKSSSLDTDENKLIVEIANFSSEQVSRSSFALKYRSDGSKIWSGSVNQELLFVTLLHLQELMAGQIDIYPILFWSEKTGRIETIDEFLEQRVETRIKVDLAYLADRLDGRGLDYWAPILEQKLQMIGHYDNDILTAEAFYSNLQSQQDVLEEMIRIIGFENLEPQLIKLTSGQNLDKSYRRIQSLKDTVLQYGFDEVITRPFVSEKKLISPSTAPTVIKPYRSTEPYLRDNLLYSLVEILSQNIKEGFKEPGVFEINSVFTRVAGLVKESKELEIVFVGENPYIATSMAYDIWRKTSRKTIQEYKPMADLDDKIAKGVWLETNVEKDTWISIKEISNVIKKQFDLPLNKKVWSVNVSLDHWDNTLFPYKTYRDESEYPVVKRSYNFEVSKKSTWKQIFETLQSISVSGIEMEITPIDKIIKNETEIMTVNIQFISYERTLTNEDIAGFEVLMKIALDQINVVYS